MQHTPVRGIAVAALLVMALLMAVPALAQSGPERIEIPGMNLFSGGLAYDAAENHFLLASAADSTIYAVADDGTLTPLIQDEALAAASSLYVDSASRLLYVVNGLGGGAGLGFGAAFGANGQPPAEFTPPAEGQGAPPQVTPQPGEAAGTFGGPFANGPLADGQFDLAASLLVYDLSSGTRLQNVDLSAIVGDENPHTASDVAVDAQGNAYITDPLAGVIYMVDPLGNTFYMANEAFANQAFAAQPQADQAAQTGQGGPGGPGGFGRGGSGISAIVYHPDGYLLVANSGAGTLWKIPLDNPANVTQVTLAEPLTGISDLAFDAQSRLVALVSGRTGAPGSTDAAAAPAVTAGAILLSSSDGWVSAAVAAQFVVEDSSVAAAAVVRGSEVYALYRSFVLPADAAATPTVSMAIARLAFGI